MTITVSLGRIRGKMLQALHFWIGLTMMLTASWAVAVLLTDAVTMLRRLDQVDCNANSWVGQSWSCDANRHSSWARQG